MTAPITPREEDRAAYRAEIRNVGRPLRLGGLGLIVVAALFVYSLSRGWLPLPPEAIVIGHAALALGWVMVLTAIYLRTRHHKRRLAEGL